MGRRLVEHFCAYFQQASVFRIYVIDIKPDYYIICTARFNISKSRIFIGYINMIEKNVNPSIDIDMLE